MKLSIIFVFRVVKVKGPSTCGQLETVAGTTIPAPLMATPPASTPFPWDLPTTTEGRPFTTKTVPQRWPSPSVITPKHSPVPTQTGTLTIKWLV